ncbi:GNAT family N-acetyltransferase [Pseudoalteromonas piscicida]|uniref:GNAT family N-acetyltransferase n=1 Tax=Pseudoalteromonas piscicida TaxID=43662 RepID=UPI00309B3F5B
MQVKDSARLSYRLLTAQDAQLLADLDSDPEVMKYITNGQTNSLEEVKAVYIPRLKQFTNDIKGWGLWGCFALPDEHFIGWILVRPAHFFTEQRNDQDLELGWRFKQAFWGKGLATEAAQQVMSELIAANPNLTHFSAIAEEENLGSINIMKKLGMTYIKKGIHTDILGDMEVVYYHKPVS